MVSEAEQQALRKWLRAWWERELPFNRRCGIAVRAWSPEEVVLELPFDEEFAGHADVPHGGMIAALVDSAGTAAVIAGHDFAKGFFPSTVSLSMNFLAPPPRRSAIVATARCSRRGMRLNGVSVRVHGADGGQVAEGILTVIVAGFPPDWNTNKSISDRIAAAEARSGDAG